MTLTVLSFQWLTAQSGCHSKSPKDITQENSADYYKEKAVYVSLEYFLLALLFLFCEKVRMNYIWSITLNGSTSGGLRLGMCELNVRTSFVSLKRMNENHKNNSTVLSLDLLSFLCKKTEMGTKKEKIITSYPFSSLFSNKDFRGCVNAYTEALKLCPLDASFYSNRAAANLALNNLHHAINDCSKVSVEKVLNLCRV